MKKANFTYLQKEYYKQCLAFVMMILCAMSSSNMYAQCSISCNDAIQISVNDDCEAELVLSMFAVPGADCSTDPADYSITLKHTDNRTILQDENGDPIMNEPFDGPLDEYVWTTAGNYLGKEIIYEITESSGNSCWGRATIEDKLPPVLEGICPTEVTVGCFESGDFVPGTFVDNCGGPVEIVIVDQALESNDCQGNLPDNIIKQMRRTITAIDQFGNVAQDVCEMILNIERINENTVADQGFVIPGVLDFRERLVCPSDYKVTEDVDPHVYIMDQSNWYIDGPGDGTVDFSNWPSSVTITGGDSAGDTRLCIDSPKDGYLGFDWAASMNDEGGPLANFNNDEPGYIYSTPGGVFQIVNLDLADSPSPPFVNMGSGELIVPLLEGFQFCFRVNSGGAGAETIFDISDISCYADDVPAYTCNGIAPGADLDNDGIPDATPAGAGIPMLISDFDHNTLIPLHPFESGEQSAIDLFNDCKIRVDYEDLVFEELDCVTKVIRTWTFREWWCGQEYFNICIQEIEIIDEEGPTIYPPHNIEASTNGYSCEGVAYVPAFNVYDACGDISQVDLSYTGGFVENFDYQNGGTIELPTGLTTVTIRAYDACHNLTEATFEINIEDRTAPVTICKSKTTVALTYNGEAVMESEVFDNQSYDDCGLKKFLVRRMNENNECTFEYPTFPDMHFLGTYGSSHYYLSKEQMLGRKAVQLSDAMGGHLVTFNTEEEWLWTMGVVSGIISDPFWIGLSDANHEGNFEWVNGDLIGYTNWAPSQPTPAPAGDDLDYVIADNTTASYLWYDALLSAIEYYVMEVPVSRTGYWSEAVKFCCTDVGNTEMVSFRAIDKWGNFNDCMVEVEVQNKVEPSISCPPDLTVACQYDFDITDLASVFGTVHEDQANVGAFHIPDEYLISPDASQLWDGYAHHNCDVTVTELAYEDNRDQCGQGTVVRTWEASSTGSSVTKRCWQYITFESTSQFDPDRIEYPNDTLLTSCMDPRDTENSLHPDDYGRPTYMDEDECDLIGYSMGEDQVFTFNNGSDDACFKVVRTWKVINWCYRDQDGRIVTDEAIQVFKIRNEVAPTLTTARPDTLFCSYADDCTGTQVELFMTATDDCTDEENLRWEYAVDLYTDQHDQNYHYTGVFDITDAGVGDTARLDLDLPIGNHLVRWTFEDRCGNKTTDDQNVSVKSCKAPTPYCLDGLSSRFVEMDNDGDGAIDVVMNEVWAVDFDNGSAGVCGNELLIAFDSLFTQTSKTYTCADLADTLADGSFEAQVWYGSILEFGGRRDTVRSYCIASFFLSNKEACSDNFTGGGETGSAMARISGTISTEDDRVVDGVYVEMDGSDYSPLLVGTNGDYAFPAMLTGGNYTVDPIKTDGIVEGVSTLDLVLIQKHILGQRELDSPYKIIAADVNNDRRLTASDIVLLRKVILGVETEFVNNDAWRFVDSDYIFYDPSNALNEAFNESYEIRSLQSDMSIDFTAVKVGDVNNSIDLGVNGNIEVRSAERLELLVDNAEVKSNENITIPFAIAKDQELLGYQFTVRFDNDVLSYTGVTEGTDFDDANIGLARVDEGIITVSWSKATPQEFAANEAIFALDFIAKTNTVIANTLNITSEVTEAEAYSSQAEVMNVSLTYRNGTQNDANKFELYQNTPNPFAETTVIGFNLPQAMNATVTIYDLTGRVVKQIEGEYSKGYNSITLRRADLNAASVLVYTLEAKDFSATKRMIVLQ